MVNELKILLVDDDKIMLFLHEMFLKKSGMLHDTVLCYNGQEALSYLDAYQSEETTFLVLLDINMPVMSGWQFLEALNTRPYQNRVHVVMVSSAIDESEQQKAFTFAQVIDYQQKPLSMDLCQSLKQDKTLMKFFTDFTA